MITKKEFRGDLYYRLNEYGIYLPPLRERFEDIPYLVDYFCHIFGEEFNKQNIMVTPETLASMMEYSWPGNIRELRAVVKRFVFSGNEESIYRAIQEDVHKKQKEDTLSNTLESHEQKAIHSALIQSKWNRRKAAELLGMSYSSLRRRMAKYSI